MIDASERHIDFESQIKALSRSQAIIEFDVDGKVIDANQNFLDITGYHLDEIRGCHHSIFVTEEEKHSTRYVKFWEKLADGEYRTGEFRRLDKNGNELWIQASYNPIFDTDNNVAKILKFSTNITEKKRAEENLRKNLQRLDIATEAGQVGLWDWDLSSNKVAYSKIWMSLLGYEHSEHPNTFETFESLTHPDDLDGCLLALNKHIKDPNIPFCKDIRMKHKKGHWVWIETTGRVVERDQKNKPLRVSGSHIDITFKKHTEDILRDEIERKGSEARTNKALLTTIINNLPVALYVKHVKNEFKYILANEKAYALSSLNSEALGKDDYEIFPKKAADAVRNRDKKVIDKKEAVSFKHKSTLHEPQQIYLHTIVAPILDKIGDVEYLVGITTDITEQVSKEIELEKASQVKDEFLANMSHELRTPLNSILGLSKILLSEDLPEEIRKSISIIDKASVSLLNTVNDILNLSKITSEDFQLEQVPFIPCNIVMKQVEIIKPLAEAKDLTFKTSNLTDNHVVFGDPLRFEMVVRNLLSNAVKYTEKGQILCNYKLIDHREYYDFEFSVSDTGIGMTQEEVDNLFKKFSQADLSTQRKYGGSGLGLHLTKTIVELFGGHVEVKSEKGQGTKFTVFIKFKAAPEADAKYAQHHTNYAINSDFSWHKQKVSDRLEDAKILIAEDQEFNRILIEKLLNRLGTSNYVIAHDGKEVMQLYEDENFDIILMDCHMPRLDGFDATKAILKKDKYSERPIPIVALTADAMIGTKEKCFSCGMAAYMSKPIDEESFQNVLKNWFILNERAKAEPYKLVKSGPVNLQILYDYTDGNHDEISELIDFFKNSTEEILSILKDSLSKDNTSEWIEAAHKLKGGAAYVGAEKLRELCEIAQNINEEENNFDKKQITHDISKEYLAVIEALEDFK